MNSTNSLGLSRGLLLPLVFAAACGSPQGRIQKALDRGTGAVQLPNGVVELHAGLRIPDGAHALEIAGRTTFVMASDFNAKAVFSCARCSGIRMRGFTIAGNRNALAKPVEMAPPENAFRLMYRNNGLWFDESTSIDIREVAFREVAGFAILASRCSRITIENVSVSDSGSRDRNRRNNTTGGIVIEEGSSDFAVRNSRFANVLGNGLWTHSLYTSQRSRDGVFERNTFRNIGRDAIQVGHATRVRVLDNRGHHIGYPAEIIDKEHEGTPVAIDTAGNVDQSAYRNNVFEEIDGKCFDLDGFHDGEVVNNSCVNRGKAEDYPYGHYALVMNDSNPDMHSRNITISGNEFNGAKFGGIYVVGGPHTIENNRLLNLNLAHCNDNPAIGCLWAPGQPDLLRSGIYLAAGVKKQDRTVQNRIEHNELTGYKIREHCIVAGPAESLQGNTITGNDCRDLP